MAATKVVIVGSGVAGAAIAAGLQARGIGPIVMLEAGPKVEMRNHRKWLDYLASGERPYDHCRDGPGDPCSSPAALSWLRESRLFVRGGSTLHWGGWCLRFRPEDFALKSATGRGADWPITYDDLEPWYGRAEQFLGVAGESADANPARSAPLPFGPLPFTQVDGDIIRGLDALGYGYGAMPIARNVEARDGHPACQTIGTCKYCPLGARYTADQTLDRLEAAPGFELRVDTVVTAILMDRRDRAAGVAYVDRATGQAGRLEADVVIICAGALETPKLLLASSGAQWPQGIGNASGHVGRHLIYHPLLFARGGKPSNPAKLQHELDFPTLCSRHFDTSAEQPAGKLFMFLPPISPALDLAALMTAGRSADDVRSAVSGPFAVELQGLMELPPGTDSRVTAGKGRSRPGVPATEVRFPAAATGGAQLALHLERMGKVLAAAGYTDVETGVYRPRGDHAAATCRMSASDADGVVGPDLRVHGVGNLYACSNAVFASGGAVNPTLTLVALAMRLADGLTAP